MLLTKRITLGLVFCFLFTACQKNNGVNKEPIFNHNPPESAVYISKLAELIKADDDQLSYYIKGYAVQNGHDFLRVNVSGPDILASAYLQINDPKGIEDIVVKHAEGYVGAELEGLKIEIVTNPKGIVFLYKSVEKIVD